MPLIAGNPLQKFAQWWHGLTPEAKQGWLNTAGEMGGGTAGAIAGGGWLSVPAAGAMAVIGRKAAESAGPLLGASGAPKRTWGQEAKDDATTFAMNAGPEGVGRAVPYALRALKPTAAALKYTAILDKMGIPTGLAERTGRQFFQQTKGVLGHIPGAAQIVQGAEREANAAWEAYMGKVLDGIDPTSVPRERLAALAEQGVQHARDTFNNRVRAELNQVANAIHPQPVTAQGAGQALNDGLAANKQTVKDWAKNAYGALAKRADALDAVADANNIEPAFSAMWHNTDPGVRHFMPAEIQALASKTSALTPRYSRKTIRALNDIASEFHAEGPGGTFATLSDAGQKEALRRAAVKGVDLTPHRYLDLQSLADLRQNLGQYIAKLDPNTQGQQLHYATALLDEVDKAAGKLPGGLAEEWAKVRGGFAQGAQATRRPVSSTGPGNPITRRIGRNSTAPEKLAEGLTAPNQPTAIAQAETATTPFEITRGASGDYARTPVAGADRPLDQTARLAVQDLGQDSMAATAQKAGGPRVSPGYINKRLLEPGARDTYRPLMGDTHLQSLEGIARPTNLEAETRLYNSPVSRAVDGGNTDGIFDAMYPKGSRVNPGSPLNAAHAPTPATSADEALSLLPKRSEGERAFAEDLVFGKDSRATNGRVGKAMGDTTTPFTDPRAVTRRMQTYGDTVDHVLGPKADDIREGVDALQYLHQPHTYSNTSNTETARRTLNLLGNIASLPAAVYAGHVMGHTGQAVAAGLAALPATAWAVTNPGVAKFATGSLQRAVPYLSSGGGFLARSAGATFDSAVPQPARKVDTALVPQQKQALDTSDEIPLDTSDEIPLDEPQQQRRRQ